jgi:hypothetical protein
MLRNVRDVSTFIGLVIYVLFLASLFKVVGKVEGNHTASDDAAAPS